MRVNAFQENVCPDRNIFGLATHKVYPRTVSPRCAVGSYPTFSPLPRRWRGGFFLWHLLFSSVQTELTFLLGSMAPCVVPTFLPRLTTGAAERAAGRCKGTTKGHSTSKKPDVLRCCLKSLFCRIAAWYQFVLQRLKPLVVLILQYWNRRL
jgi:hypothetical protein